MSMKRAKKRMELSTFKHRILPIKDKLYGLALRITGNPQEAEDVVQETFIKVWEQRTELGGIKNIEAWCMQLTKNRSIDKRRLRFNQSEGLEQAMGLSCAEQGPDRQAELSDDMQQVQRLMAELPEPQRRAIAMRDMDGMSYQEIADAMQISLQQVKTHIFRGRQRLRAKLTALWKVK